MINEELDFKITSDSGFLRFGIVLDDNISSFLLHFDDQTYAVYSKIDKKAFNILLSFWNADRASKEFNEKLLAKLSQH